MVDVRLLRSNWSHTPENKSVKRTTFERGTRTIREKLVVYAQVVEWQTRTFEVRMPLVWGFKSPPGHHQNFHFKFFLNLLSKMKKIILDLSIQTFTLIAIRLNNKSSFLQGAFIILSQKLFAFYKIIYSITIPYGQVY